MEDQQFSVIRIDSSLGGGAMLYFFVETSHERWDPWWRRLYSFLCSLARADLEWKPEPIQNVMFARLALSEEQKTVLLDVLRTAPAAEIAAHKTLKLTIDRLSKQSSLARVVFFRDVPS